MTYTHIFYFRFFIPSSRTSAVSAARVGGPRQATAWECCRPTHYIHNRLDHCGNSGGGRLAWGRGEVKEGGRWGRGVGGFSISFNHSSIVSFHIFLSLSMTNQYPFACIHIFSCFVHDQSISSRCCSPILLVRFHCQSGCSVLPCLNYLSICLCLLSSWMIIFIYPAFSHIRNHIYLQYIFYPVALSRPFCPVLSALYSLLPLPPCPACLVCLLPTA